MKRPAFQFYPADWRKDAALQSCSLSAQGLWINLMCIAHECDPYGHLVINNIPMTTAQIARFAGLSAKECDILLLELQGSGVFTKNEDGCIFSRRMVKDERLRNLRAEGGKVGAEHGDKGAIYGALGGRPKDDKKPPLEPPLTPPLEPPPSSSSSSSSSTSKTKQKKDAALSVVLPDFIPQKAWQGYVQMRKVAPTEYAVELIIKQLQKMHSEGQDVGAVLDQSTANSWTSLYPLKTQQGAKNGKLAAIAENNRRLNELIEQELAGNVAQGGLGTRIAQTPWDDLPK